MSARATNARGEMGSSHLAHRQPRPFELRWTNHLKLPERNTQTTQMASISRSQFGRHCILLFDSTPRMAELVPICRGQVATLVSASATGNKRNRRAARHQSAE